MNKLGRKQRISNADWMAAAKDIDKAISKQELDGLVERTTGEVREKTAGKKAAFAWSGGKDSLVLERICQMADIQACVLVTCDLEYPSFIEWVEKNKPAKLEIVNTGQDLKWLAAHPQMLFPQNSKTTAQWFNIVQHRGQARYYKENNLDVLLLGRRKADGNYVGKGSNIYTNGQGVTRYSPLAEWSHEQILAFIHYYKIDLPPFYEWHNGYCCGTHPWAARPQTGSIENGWKEVYGIDPSIVIGAAEHLPSAQAYLESLR
ncbi:phosphoadenosine phosphosulfate reductase family protein [Clostridiales Family XIII bacterium ASD5510]|uniref:Phosphoadenosine phosphosulfate reductase family protein n=1 Tax=Hominibacterium faecale TaxID=2839743 RepID=A0A9J6QYC8_9FIRM|nr:phosphoadenosine phosphosulfate reductase family protein [Hominibacterium faecale]MCU7380497.1 phosphoadenosine phosphosulfate reductase family protein [Hominibacterium faecale]